MKINWAKKNSVYTGFVRSLILFGLMMLICSADGRPDKAQQRAIEKVFTKYNYCTRDSDCEVLNGGVCGYYCNILVNKAKIKEADNAWRDGGFGSSIGCISSGGCPRFEKINCKNKKCIGSGETWKIE